jgi:diketogulonate reductase-like aldo/keto reductase
MQSLFKSNIGLGTNRLGGNFKEDLASLHYALDLGYCVIDTAEKYMNQASEQVIGKCLQERSRTDRELLQIVTKVQPQNSIIDSCMSSLCRLQTDYIDMYLLHWRENVNLESVIVDMLILQEKGYIKYFGVSNFTTSDIVEWKNIEQKLTSTSSLVINQIKYNFNDRSAEKDLIPYHQNNNIKTKAHSPLDKGQALINPDLISYAHHHGISVAQAALKWVLRTPGVIAIPNSTTLHRLIENLMVSKM